MRSYRWRTFAIVVPSLLLLAGVAIPQAASSAQESGVAASSSAPSAVSQAMSRRDSGDLAGAAALLRERLATEPSDGEAARLLAQTLYWLKDIPGATAVYETAMVRHPEDSTLRLEYGRMLVETRRDVRAVEVLAPLTNAQSTRPRAETLLGTLHYWRGDLTAAARSFRAALAADSTASDARRQLNEIRALASPWTTVRSAFFRDDQPMDALQLEAEAGWFATPLLSVAARLRPIHFRIADSASADVLLGEAGISHVIPSARLETRLTGGAVRQSSRTATTDWTARGNLVLRLPGHLSLAAVAERMPYLSTLASLSTLVMTRSAALSASLKDPRGWLGEAFAQTQRFPDTNSVTTAYAWILAPVVRKTGIDASVGYSFATQDANESRFTLARPIQSVPPTSPSFSTEGRYVPYYTPEKVVSHSLLGSVALRPSPVTTVRIRGAYAVRAMEDEPSLVVVSGTGGPARIDRAFVRRSFTPWDAHLTVESAIGRDASIVATADRMATAFYSASSIGLQLVYRFVAYPSRH